MDRLTPMAHLHLIVGDDDLLLHRAMRDLIDRLEGDDDLLHVTVHEAEELEALPSLRTMSLLGDRSGVAIRGLESARVSGVLRDELVAFLDDPDEQAVLVLTARGKRKVQAISRRMKQVGTITEVAAPKPWDDRGWTAIVVDEFARLGVVADHMVAGALRAHSGADSAAIASQVAQVVATAEGDVTVEHVDDVLAGHGRESAFAVVDAVVDRDVAAALVALRGLVEAGESPMLVLGALVSRFRQLLALRAGLTSPADVGASPGQIRHLRGPARANFAAGELAWCQERLARLDVDLKGGSPLDAVLVLELAVIDLATPREITSRRHNPLAVV